MQLHILIHDILRLCQTYQTKYAESNHVCTSFHISSTYDMTTVTACKQYKFSCFRYILYHEDLVTHAATKALIIILQELSTWNLVGIPPCSTVVIEYMNIKSCVPSALYWSLMYVLCVITLSEFWWINNVKL